MPQLRATRRGVRGHPSKGSREKAPVTRVDSTDADTSDAADSDEPAGSVGADGDGASAASPESEISGGTKDGRRHQWRALLVLGGLVYASIGVMALMPRSPIVPGYPPGITRYSPYTPIASLFHGSPAYLIGVFVVLTVVAFAIGFRAWRLAHEGEAVKIVFAGALLFSGLLIFTPPIISQDAYSYASYGRMVAIHDKNPYMNGPSAIPEDPASNYVGRMWWEMPSVYGPVIQAGTSGLAWLVRDLSAYIMALKLLTTLVLWAGLWLLVDIARHIDRSPTLALVVVGWNPLVIIHVAGGGHNDIFMAVALLGAFALHLRKHENLAIVALGLGAMVKFLAGVPLVLYLILRWKETEPAARLKTTAKSLALLAAMAILGYLPFWAGNQTFGALLRVGSLSSDISIPSVVGRVSAIFLHFVGLRSVTGGQMIFVARVVGGIIFAIYFVHLARTLDHDSQLPEVWGKALLVYCLTTGYLLPWYLIWAIFPLALAPESGALKIALAAGFAYSFTQLPSGYVLLTTQTRRIGEWVGLMLAPVLVLAGVAYFIYRRRRAPRIGFDRS